MGGGPSKVFKPIVNIGKKIGKSVKDLADEAESLAEKQPKKQGQQLMISKIFRGYLKKNSSGN